MTMNHNSTLGLPNILLLLTDQFRYDAFGPQTTPNLFKLSKSPSTISFANVYASTPTCTPSRAGLLTGKSPWNHGMLGYGNALDCQKYPTSLPEVLRDFGYKTVVVGKNHFGTTPEGNFISHGYQKMTLYEGLSGTKDDYEEFFQEKLPGVDPLSTCHLGWNDWEGCPYAFEEYLHPTAWTTREAKKAILETDDRTQTTTPTFWKISYHRPHSPYDPPKRFWEEHISKKEEGRYGRNRGNPDTCWDQEFSNIPMSERAWQGDPSDADARTSRAAYLANVAFVDEGIGRILDALGERIHNTLVIWTSDHGDMNGDHNLWRKGYPWEASSKVNLVMHFPFKIPSVRSEALVELRDIAPTVYDVLGILPEVALKDPLLNGKSLLPIAKGTIQEVRSYLDLEHSIVYDDRIHWNALVGTIPQGDEEKRLVYKYIFFAKDGKEQLFCLTKDPLEHFDLSTDPSLDPILEYWRDVLVKQFETEGRGTEWVKDGQLVIGRRGITYGQNYPCLSELNSNQIDDGDDTFQTVAAVQR